MSLHLPFLGAFAVSTWLICLSVLAVFGTLVAVKYLLGVLRNDN